MGATSLKYFDARTAGWASEKPDASGGNPAAMIAAVVKAKGFNYRGAGLLQKPEYQNVMNAAVWDSKRKRIVFIMNRFMTACDPATKKWEDMKAKSVINGREYTGGPPVFGAGACYDPVSYASSNWLYESGFDPGRRLLIVSQTLGKKKSRHAETYVMKLDLAPPRQHPLLRGSHARL